MDPELKVGDCRHIFKCRRCGESFYDQLPDRFLNFKVAGILPIAESYTSHECPDGTGAIAVADFIALIPIQKP